MAQSIDLTIDLDVLVKGFVLRCLLKFLKDVSTK